MILDLHILIPTGVGSIFSACLCHKPNKNIHYFPHTLFIQPWYIQSLWPLSSSYSVSFLGGLWLVCPPHCVPTTFVLGQCGYSSFPWVGWGVWVIKFPTQNLSQVTCRQYSQSKEENKYLLSLPLWGRVYCDLYICVLNVRHCAVCLSCTPSISWRFPYQNLPPLCFSGRGENNIYPRSWHFTTKLSTRALILFTWSFSLG